MSLEIKLITTVMGLLVSGFYKFEALENVFIENRLALYTDYLGEPDNIDFDYTLAAARAIAFSKIRLRLTSNKDLVVLSSYWLLDL